MLPPCSSAIFFATARPKPVPLALLVVYGSNQRSPKPSGRPGPLSAIASSIQLRSLSVTAAVLTSICGLRASPIA